MPSPAQIQERLRQTHLGESEEDLKQQVAKATAVAPPTDEEMAPGEDPRDKEEYPFKFRWTDSRGKLWQGDFVNKILNIEEQQQRAVFQSTLQGGLPYESFSSMQRSLNTAVAHMSYSLIKRPKWAENLRGLLDRDLVFELGEEVTSHEDRFWRRKPDSSESGGEKPGISDSA